MSETPRTDGESKWDALNGWWVPSDFSRTLERELAAAHAASEALQPGIDHLRETCDALERERNEARTKRLQTLANVADECDALRAEVEALREVLIGIRDRDFKLSDAKRRARRALTRVEEPKPVCGECHLQPGERCDVCGATDPRPKPAEEPK